MPNLPSDTIATTIRAAANAAAAQSDLSSDVIFAKVASELRHVREQNITTALVTATAIACAGTR